MNLYYRPPPLHVAALLVRRRPARSTPHADAFLAGRWAPPATWLTFNLAGRAWQPPTVL